jgi:hypothetical protein
MGCGDAAKDSGDTSDPAVSDAAVDESDDLDADADADDGSDDGSESDAGDDTGTSTEVDLDAGPDEESVPDESDISDGEDTASGADDPDTGSASDGTDTSDGLVDGATDDVGAMDDSAPDDEVVADDGASGDTGVVGDGTSSDADASDDAGAMDDAMPDDEPVDDEAVDDTGPADAGPSDDGTADTGGLGTDDDDGSDDSITDDGADSDDASATDGGSTLLPSHRECSSDADCDADYFCGIECWSAPCGMDETIEEGTLGAYCQPCIECHSGTDAVSGSCDVCGGPAYDMDVDAGPGPVDSDEDSDGDSDWDSDWGDDSDETSDTDDGGTAPDADTPIVIPASVHWRVVNIDAVEDHWNVSEMTFFEDRSCTSSLSGLVTDIMVASTEYCSDPPAVLNDGACNFEGHCVDGNWANQSAMSGAGEIWAGYELATAASVGCISICQGALPIHRLSQLAVEKSDDGGVTWDRIQTVTTDSTDPLAPTLFVLD